MTHSKSERRVPNPKLKAAKGKVSFESVSLLFVFALARVLGKYFVLYVLPELGNAMLEGGGKYGRHNFRDAGGRVSTYVFATMRHILAHLFRQDIDHDSGVPHVTKAIASLCTLYDIVLFEKLDDDRPPALSARKRNTFFVGLGSVFGERGIVFEKRSTRSSYTLAWEAFMHLALYWEGSENDLNTKQSHLMEAAASLWLLRSNEICGSIVDDRPRALTPKRFKQYSDMLLSQFRGIEAKYPNPVAPHTRTHIGKSPRKQKREMWYISGKITNEDPVVKQQNLERFHEVAKKLRAEKKKVFSPAEHERDDWTWAMYMAHFSKWIMEHRPVLYMLKGWRNSLGASQENELAKLLGLRIIYEED